MTQPISPLVAEVMTASLTESQRTTQYLIDRLTEQLAEAHAREQAVHEGVMDLFEGRYMPTPAAVRRALYPSPERIALYRERAS